MNRVAWKHAFYCYKSPLQQLFQALTCCKIFWSHLRRARYSLGSLKMWFLVLLLRYSSAVRGPVFWRKRNCCVFQKWLRKSLIVPGWDNAALTIDWAIPNDNPDEEAAEKSTAIMVNGIPKSTYPGITDAALREVFSKYGEVRSVRRKETNAKINYFDHDHAVAAIAGENGKELQGAKMEIAVSSCLTVLFVEHRTFI